MRKEIQDLTNCVKALVKVLRNDEWSKVDLSKAEEAAIASSTRRPQS